MFNLSGTTHRLPSLLSGIAIALILVTGLIHLVDAPDNFSESAYKGILFLLNGGLALIAAVGIYQGSKVWGWGAGLVAAGGALVMYIISRTVGLPGIGVDDAWLEPMGVLSLIVEAGYLITALLMFTRSQDNDRGTASNQPQTPANQYR